MFYEFNEFMEEFGTEIELGENKVNTVAALVSVIEAKLA